MTLFLNLWSGFDFNGHDRVYPPNDQRIPSKLREDVTRFSGSSFISKLAWEEQEKKKRVVLYPFSLLLNNIIRTSGLKVWKLCLDWSRDELLDNPFYYVQVLVNKVPHIYMWNCWDVYKLNWPHII